MLVFCGALASALLGKHTDASSIALSNRCPINARLRCYARTKIRFSELEGSSLFNNGIVRTWFRNVRYVDVCTAHGVRLTCCVFDLTNHFGYCLSGGCLCRDSASGEVGYN